MPFFEYVQLLFGGGNSLLNTTQIVVEHDIEIRLPVIPFHIERLAGYSDQLVQGFSEPVELPAHGLTLRCAGRWIAPPGLQRKVHQDLVVLGVGPGVGFLESVILPLAVAGRHDPATRITQCQTNYLLPFKQKASRIWKGDLGGVGWSDLNQ